MSVQNRLQEKVGQQARLVEEINALADKRQRLLEEALRVDGEIRLLKELEAESCREPMPK